MLRAIATDGPQVLCGDFNATPAHDEIRFLRGETTLAGRRTHYQDAWSKCHPQEPGHTWCTQNPLTQSQRSLDVDRRIDYIFATTRADDGRGAIRDAQVVLDGRDARGECASDHYGVQADIQIAPD